MTARLGLIGLGNWGNRLATTLASMPDVALATCFARSEQRREAFAERHACRAAPSLEAMLDDDVDGVVIATPHRSHEQLVVAAAEAGKAIMVEKPLTLDLAGAERCVAAAEGAGVVLQVAHYRRRLGATRVLRSLIDDGTIGRIHHIDGRFHRSWGPDTKRPWRNTIEEAPAGAMTALGVHLIDNFLYLGGPVERLSARSEQLGRLTAIDDMTVVHLEFASGALGTMATSLRLPFESTTAVYGDGAAAWSERDGTFLFVQTAEEDERSGHPVEKVDGVRANLEAFVRCIVTGEAPETDGAAGLEVVRILEAIVHSSAACGTWIDL